MDVTVIHQPVSNQAATDPINLFGTIASMDAIAQSGFAACSSISKQALADLEGSEGTVPHPQALADALRAIWGAAQQFGNDINVKAEVVGCNAM